MADTTFCGGSKRPDSCTIKNWKFVAVTCLMLLNTCLLVTFAGLVIRWSVKRHEALQPVAATICLPHIEFHQQTCPAATHDIDYKCCGHASVILQELLSQKLSTTFASHFASRLLSGVDLECEIVSPNICYANLVGLDYENQRHDLPCHWLDVKTNRANYHEGRIYIKEPGFYFVHSQIKLNPSISNRTMTSNIRNAGDIVSDKSVTYIHNIKHYSFKRQETKVLLQNTRHHCVHLKRNFNTTMSTGAVYWLDKRDHLYVSTSHPDQLVHSIDDNRFSVVKLEI